MACAGADLLGKSHVPCGPKGGAAGHGVPDVDRALKAKVKVGDVLWNGQQ